MSDPTQARPHYQDATVTLHHGDCLDVLRSLPDSSVDAVVTDPPYGLEFMGKEWDGADGFRRALNPADVERDNPSGRTSRTSPEYRAGALFQQWCELWATECLRVLKPGGHMLAFGGTRTWHRLACAVEDAGFEIRDSIAWMYGSGFPKSLDVSKAIDKAGRSSPAMQSGVLRAARERANMTRDEVAAVVGCTPSSVRDWEEGRARAVGLAVEHITPSLAYRTALADLLGYTADERSVVGVTVDRRNDGSVIGLGHSGTTYGPPATPDAERWQGWGTALKPAFEPIVVARKPLAGTVAGNVLAHGTGAINVGACRTKTADNLNGGAYAAVGNRSESASLHAGSGMNVPGKTVGIEFVQPSGRWPANVILDESQADALDTMSGELTSGANPTRRGVDGERTAYGDFAGQENANPQRGTDTGGASRFYYVAKADAGERISYLRFACLCEGPATVTIPSVRSTGDTCPTCGAGTRRVAHPTVKPLELMRWLVRLITPPGGTVLEPFPGSGTTVEACILEGFKCVAAERDGEYLPLMVQRVHRRRDPVAAVRGSGEELGLFGLFEEGTP